MSNQRYPEEFKIEAVKHITERGLRVADVAERLGVSAHSLYAWVKRYSKPQIQRQQVDDQQAELRRLRAELKRVTEERDILKRPPRTLPRSPAEVRRYQQTVGGVPGTASLPDPPYIPAVTTPAGRAEIRACQGRSASARIDQACGWKAAGSTATARSTTTCVSWASPVAGTVWLA